MENVIILGTGISGCTAGIYTARAELKPLIISGMEDGGQLTLTSDVENFPGFPEGVGGTELVQKARKQAERFGARFKMDLATEFNQIEGGCELTLMSGEKIQTKTLIISTGASARWLEIPSEEKFKGRGVSACATCDGAFFKEKEVIVVGGGDSAMEEALFLTKFASKVTIVHRRNELRASKIMRERAQKHPTISFVWNSQVAEIVGDKLVEGVKLKNVNSEKITYFKCDGVFLGIGHVPNTKIFKGKLDMDENDYLKTDRFMHTSIPGIFAAGDAQDTKYRQAITAAGSGCQAALEVERYLVELE